LIPCDPIQIGPELAALLYRLSRIYCGDMSPEDALIQPFRVLRRAMDFATWEDILEMERIVGPTLLTQALKTALMGALRPKSWSFRHVRLGLYGPGGEIPPEPNNWFAETDADPTFIVRSP
jgi:hypothetical protein